MSIINFDTNGTPYNIIYFISVPITEVPNCNKSINDFQYNQLRYTHR